MTDYLIRTDIEHKKTFLAKLGTSNKLIGTIYTEFLVSRTRRDITIEDVVNSDLKLIANIHLLNKNNYVELLRKRKTLSAFTKDKQYFEDGKQVPYKMVSKTELLINPTYASLKELGITHAYFLADQSVISNIFCYEKDENISAIVSVKKDEDDVALRSIPLFLSERIMKQEYVFSFIKG